MSTSTSNLTRRGFLKGVGVVGAGAAMGEQILQGAQPPQQDSSGLVAGETRIRLKINGQDRDVQAEPRTTLLSAMRDRLDPAVTGPKLVCGEGTCGACTVSLDGKPVYSCLVLAIDAAGREITTAEGFGTTEKMNAVQTAFCEKDALMCGFCTPGFITTLSSHLKAKPESTDEELRKACAGNFCRCGTYTRVFEAALAAAKTSASAAG